MSNANLLALESLVDKSSAGQVLSDLAVIMSLKADHIRENWQDERLARKWDSASLRVEKLAAQIVRGGV